MQASSAWCTPASPHPLIEPVRFAGAKTIVDDYLREVRPLFASSHSYQRTVYQSGEICRFDLWEPAAEIPSDTRAG
jgi:hypothetical protein